MYVLCISKFSLAWIMATKGNHIAILNIFSAFLCHIGSFSNKCRNKMWNYRIIKKEDNYGLYEVFYNDKGNICPFRRTRNN